MVIDEDDDFGPFVTDAGDGVDLSIPIADGVTITFYMTDDAAKDLISIIQNKLNARF